MAQARERGWEPLAERLGDLPLILCGPILRRVEPGAVTVWVALREPRRVTLRVYGRDAAGAWTVTRLVGTRRTVRAGERLHVAAVTARVAGAGAAPLAPGLVNCYDLFFDDGPGGEAGDGPEGSASLRTPGVLVADPATADEVAWLVYAGLPLPSLVLP